MPSAHSIRRISAIVAVVLGAVVFVPPLIRLKILRADIVQAISNALGRQATISDVSLRLFPQPGFDLKGLIIQDDPAFSAEPLLRADEVTATLRLSSLWRRRLEIGSLSLKSPNGGQPWSLNVVRAQDGRWNLAALLTRASQTPSAPTSKVRPEARPRFPYIEGEGGRINFKSGIEKKAYALSEADFALWLASENEWNMRLSARPMRTDGNLTDTGIVEVSGAFGRALRLEEMPLRLRVSLRRAQLGQLTRLIYSRDRGWRGSVNVAADLTGTAQDLRISASGSIDDFRRYNIIVPDNVRLEARCAARYQWPARHLSGIDCQAQNGEIVVRGAVTGLPGEEDYDLVVVAKDVPMAEIARTARHAKFALPADLTADGDLDAEFTCRTAAQPGECEWAGSGATTGFILRSGVLGQELKLGSIRFAVGKGEPKAAPGRHAAQPVPAAVSGPRLIVMPFPILLGSAAPLTIRAYLSRTDYSIDLHGDAELQRLFRVARGLGVHAPALVATGSAKLDLEVAGNWSGFTAPVATGTLQLRNLIMPVKGVATPAHVRSATAVLLPGEVQVQNLAASFGDGHMAIDGSIILPRTCESAPGCPVRFDLHAGELDIDELNRLLNPQLQRVPWYRLLVSDTGASLGKLQARGRIRVDRLLLKELQIDHLVAQAELNSGHLRLSDVRGGTLGGKLRADWRADFTRTSPTYSGAGSFERISMGQVSALTRQPFGTGTTGGKFTLELSGWNAAELFDSSEGLLEFDWQNGTLPQMAFDSSSGPLRIKHLIGRATLRNSRLQFAQSKMDTPDGIYVMSGTASLGRLDLKLLGRASRGYAVSGTLEKPRVAALSASETQTALAK